MLEMAKLLVFLALSSLAYCHSPLPLSSVVKYFRASSIYSISLILCSPQYDKLKTAKSLSAKGFSISFSLDHLTERSHRTGALLDLACPFDYSIPYFSSEDIEWLVFGESEERTIDLLPALPDTSVTLLRDDMLLDVYRPAISEPIRLANYTGMHRNHHDFGGIVLTAAQIAETSVPNNEEPEMIYGGLECLNDQYGGWNTTLSLHLVHNLAFSLNFSLKIVETEEPGCRGLEKLLKTGKAEFSTTALMVTQRRLDFLTFSTHLFDVKSRILYKQPSLSTITNIYVLPFDTNVWISCLITFFLALVVMCIALRAGGAFEEPYVTPADMFTLVIGFVCQQGTELSPKSLTVRTTIVIFSLSALFLYTSYSANIVALLQNSSPTVTTLAELTASPLKLALQDAKYNKICYEGSKEKGVQNLVEKKKVNDKSYISAEEGIIKVREGTTAFTVETSMGYKLISEQFEEAEKCGLSELHVFTLPPVALPLVKLSGYREQFSRLLTLQLECGLVSRVLKQQVEDKPHCSSMDSGYVSVKFEDFKPALLVLMYGVAASFMAFVLEVVTARIKKDKPLKFQNIYK